jgi:hypothetical protein
MIIIPARVFFFFFASYSRLHLLPPSTCAARLRSIAVRPPPSTAVVVAGVVVAVDLRRRSRSLPPRSYLLSLSYFTYTSTSASARLASPPVSAADRHLRSPPTVASGRRPRRNCTSYPLSLFSRRSHLHRRLVCAASYLRPSITAPSSSLPPEHDGDAGGGGCRKLCRR